MQFINTLDTLIARALFVPPRPPSNVPPINTRPQERVLTLSLVFSGTRCFVQYVILPFVLPLIGMASMLSLGLVALIDAVALVALVFSLRRFWQANHAHKWTYLILAVGVFSLITVYLWYDLQALFG